MSKIEEIDSNFQSRHSENERNQNVLTLPAFPFRLHGIVYTEGVGFHRIPLELADSIREPLAYLNRMTAGGRVTFRTDSPDITVTATYGSLDAMPHMALTGSAGFVLSRYENGKFTYIGTVIPTYGNTAVTKSFHVSDSGKAVDYVLYFPLYNRVCSLTVALDNGATISEDTVYQRDKAPILYYGSSITQGGCASRPDNCYEALVSEALNTDFVNLGFSGNALAEDGMIEYLAEQNPSVFVLDYDYNAPSAEHLAFTHPRLLQAFVSRHPNTPVIVLSRPNYYASDRKHIDESRARLRIIEKSVRDFGSRNVYLIKGKDIYPKNLIGHCDVDGCHPTDLGFFYMAKRVSDVIKKNGLL